MAVRSALVQSFLVSIALGPWENLVEASTFQLKQVYVSKQNQTGEIKTKNLNVVSSVAFFEKPAHPVAQTLKVLPHQPRHEIWGFGASVTESCMSLYNSESLISKNKIMKMLFDKDEGAGLSFLRVPLGANDFSKGDYTLDDLAPGETDPELKKLNLKLLDPFIKFILQTKLHSPYSSVMVTPWTPPPWMKDTQAFKGGQLKKEFFPAYAEYIRRSMAYLAKNGIRVGFLTAMNEPLIGEAKTWWYFPQGYMSIEDQYEFTQNHLIPLLKKYSLGPNNFPRVLLHDHNWGNAEETVNRFKDVLKKKQNGIAGVAMHCYGGDFSVQQNFHKKWEGVGSLNSECTANIYSQTPQFDFQWWLENQVVDSTQIGSRGALAWNLCLDEKGGPRNNGCANCRGLVTINKAKKTLEVNAEYYALAQVSRFVRRGARVVDHFINGDTALRALTFINPDGSLVLVVRNPSGSEAFLNLQIGDELKNEALRLPSQSAVTFKFQ